MRRTGILLWVIAAMLFAFFYGFTTGKGVREQKHLEQIEVEKFSAYHRGFTEAHNANISRPPAPVPALGSATNRATDFNLKVWVTPRREPTTVFTEWHFTEPEVVKALMAAIHKGDPLADLSASNIALQWERNAWRSTFEGGHPGSGITLTFQQPLEMKDDYGHGVVSPIFRRSPDTHLWWMHQFLTNDVDWHYVLPKAREGK